MTRTGVDYSWSRPAPDAIAASGASFVARYHSNDLRTMGGSTPKILTRTEAVALSFAGLDIVSVWEGVAADRDPMKGYAQGRIDGEQALRQAASCGAPPGVVIYYAVDWQASDTQLPTIGDYFEGVADAHGGPETVGVYGSFAVVEYLMSMGRTGYGWQTYAWSGGRWHPSAQLRQVKNDQRLMPSGLVGSAAQYPAGAAIDLDEAHADDFGQWGVTMTSAPADLLAVQAYSRAVSGLPWASLGIVGDTSHNSSGGYHVGRDVLHLLGRAPEDPGGDYSYTESPRDRAGLSNSASAFDQGDFSASYGGRVVTHRRLIDAVLAEVAKPGRGRAKDLREMIYQEREGSSVIKRWDALGIRSTGDSTHEGHTHFSFFRDSEGRRDGGDNFLGLMREAYEPTAAPTPTPKPEALMPLAYPVAMPVNVGDVVEITIPPSNVGNFAGLDGFAKIVLDRTEALLYRVAFLAPGGPVDLVSKPSGSGSAYQLKMGGTYRKWGEGLPTGIEAVKIERLATGDTAADALPRRVAMCVDYG